LESGNGFDLGCRYQPARSITYQYEQIVESLAIQQFRRTRPALVPSARRHENRPPQVPARRGSLADRCFDLNPKGSTLDIRN
jgi:hypothetical protein